MSRRRQTSLPSLTEDAEHLVQDLERESDRGAALLGAAFLDDVLDAMLRACLIDDRPAVDRLLGPGRPIESFGGRTHLAFAMGLIGVDVYGDINVIREIRNDFAHRKPATFAEGAILAKCRKLQAIEVLSPDPDCDGRERFVITVVLLVNYLTGRAAQMKNSQVGPSFAAHGVIRVQ